VGAFLAVNFEGEWGNVPLFGLCDAKGRIICDPVYNEVKTLEKDGAKLYKFSIFRRGEPKKRNARITLAKPDGTWAGEYDDIVSEIASYERSSVFSGLGFYGDISWRPIMPNEYISVKKGDKWGAIDYNGKEILPCVYNAPLYFSEGLAAIVSDDGKEIRFIDSSGKVNLGTYQTPPKYLDPFLDFEEPPTYGLVFSEGKTQFYKDGKYGVIDKSGSFVIEAKYDYISSFSDGNAKFISGKKAGIIGIKGEVLLEQTDTSFQKRDDGTIVIDEKGGSKSLNILTGERKPWSFEWNPNKLSNGNLCQNISGSNPTWKIISPTSNPSGTSVAGPFDGKFDYIRSGLIYINLGKYSPDSDYHYWETVYSEAGKRLIPGYYLSITPFDGRYLVYDDTDAGLLNEDGRWVIKVPRLEYMGD
jgi:hypothetical protein